MVYLRYIIGISAMTERSNKTDKKKPSKRSSRKRTRVQMVIDDEDEEEEDDDGDQHMIGTFLLHFFMTS